MKWREDLNESYLQDGKVHYRVFAEGEGMTISIDGRKTWNPPNIEKEGVKGWLFIVEPNGKGLDFDVSEWGFSGEPTQNKITPTQPPVEVVENHSNADFNFRNMIFIPDYVKENQEEYFNKFRSMVKNIPRDFDSKRKVRLEFPSNTISYNKRKEQGTLIASTVSLFDEFGTLLIQSTGFGVIEGNKPFGNNHGCYYLIPEGKYKVVISNDDNNGLGDESWIEATAFRQDANSSSAYFDFGQPVRINKGQSKDFDMDCYDGGQPSLLFKVNNISR